jgi:single-strand DNA-binding protein
MYQKLIFIGNLGSNPEQRFTPSGDPVTTFSVATSRKYGERDETTWFRVSVWGKQAEACSQYLHKGSKVLVDGRLRPDESGNPRVFERKDGSSGASFEVTAESVRFLDGKARDDVDDSYSADVPF